MNQRIERAQQSRERLIASAAKLLAERGWARAGSSEIGEGAGMSRGAAHAHFGSKETLLVAVWDDTVSRFEHEWGRLGWPVESLELLLEAYWQLVSHNDLLRRVAIALLIESRDPSSPLKQRAAQVHVTVARAVTGDIERLRPDASLDSAAFASLMIASLRGLALELSGEDDPAANQRFADVRQMLLRCARPDLKSY